MVNNEYKKWYLVLGMFAIVAMFFGGSLAYWQWTTNTAERTSITLTVTEEFRCDADGGGDISSEEKYLVPTDCTNSDYAILRTIKVNPTLFSNNTNVSMDLWLNVNNIGTGLKNSENLMYSLTTSSTSCTNGLVTYGSFNGKGNGSKIELLNNNLYSSTYSDTYYLYIWLDKKETSQSTMNQSFNFTLGGECTGTSKGEPFYAVYSVDDTSLRFYKEDEGVIVEGEQYEGRIATNVYKAYDGDSYTFNSSTNSTTSPWDEVKDVTTKIVVEDEISPISTAKWFTLFTKTSSVDVTNLDMSNVVDANRMFDRIGYSNSVTNFLIMGLDDWDVSNVTNMRSMFQYTGYYATEWNIGDLSNWDVSNVSNMYGMFALTGYSATTFDIGNLDNWDVSNVSDISFMFRETGYKATTFDIGDLSGWNVSNVVNIMSMFDKAGYSTGYWNIGDLSNWDVFNVRNMSWMFDRAGYNSTSWDIGDLSNWNVSNVVDMTAMFQKAGYSATTWNIGNLNNWDVSNVNNMYLMFFGVGSVIGVFDIGNLDNWDVSNVTNMRGMFARTGYNALTWNIGDLSNWNVSSVTNTSGMFENAGYSAITFSIGDLSNWDVSNVTDMSWMFNYSGYSATAFDIGDLSEWDVSSVTTMENMFNRYSDDNDEYSLNTTFNIGNISRWNVSKVTNMKRMFNGVGYNDSDYSLDLSSWNVPLVTTYTDFNKGVETKITPPVWNTSS